MDKLSGSKRYIVTSTLVKLNVGCGPEKIDGYIGCDLLPGPAVDKVCPADKLPFDNESVDEILAEHLIEHLTFYDFNRTMYEWARVLKPEGFLVLEFPDLLGLCKQFIESNEYQRYHTYKGQWPIIAHLYGHQRGKNRDEEMSQVHKSGYTYEYIKEVLIGLGFYSDIPQRTPKKATPYSPVIRIEAQKAKK